eukprot:TRINITY_DN15034_c0_g1_i1.p1 TRINITY_DN15034_c0_g1~~TRINITY_DN15034_c0_g1_i1.p1  ORF type:complete len:166 (-),score=28.23 TRINITY_DN15034_c0_g1_i1:35-532(-)
MGRKFVQTTSSELIVMAKLMHKADNCPVSGSTHYGLVMKYQVVRVVQGVYLNSFIYVAHGAPELARAVYYKHCGSLTRFLVGDLHRLRLKLKLETNASPFDIMIDPYSQDKSKRYLCLKADKILNGEDNSDSDSDSYSDSNSDYDDNGSQSSDDSDDEFDVESDN